MLRHPVSTVIATSIFIALVVLVVGFQLALAAGIPWGELTWGGRFPGKLPRRMRVICIVSAIILVFCGVIVAVRTGFAFSEWQQVTRKAIWGVVAYCALGVVANAVTPSKWERIIWLPVVLLMLICSTVVAVG